MFGETTLSNIAKYALHAINLVELSVYLDISFCESLQSNYAVKSPLLWTGASIFCHYAACPNI